MRYKAEINSKKLVYNIRKHMVAHGMSQKMLSDISGCDPKLICTYISGKRIPQVRIFYSLSKALGVTMEELLEGVME